MPSMSLDKMLSATRIKSNANCASKKKALETLAELMANSVEPPLNTEELFQQLIARERLGSTGVGQGIAIPHCRFATHGASLCAVMTLAAPIDFDAIDSQPVDIVFAMLVPKDANSEHLQNLASLAEVLQQSHYVQQLRSANNNQQLYEAAVAPFLGH